MNDRPLPQRSAIAPARAKPLLFLHIPKTAGTSFLVMLQNLFADRQVLRLAMEDTHLAERLNGLSAGARDQFACINGHLPAHIFAAELDQYEPFTLLRNPVQRVLSLYRFLRRHPAETLAAQGLRPDFSFDDFIDARHPQLFEQVHNGMTRMLSGLQAASDPQAALFWTLDEQPAVLDGALATLGRIDFGLVEQFAATHALLRERWGIPFALAPMRLNTTATGEAEADVGRIRRIVERNQLDIALYEAASAIFAQRSRVATRPPAAMRDDAVWAPSPNTPASVGDMPGRQGFHPFEAVGFAWLDGTGPARIHLRPPLPRGRIELSLYTIAPFYPAGQIAIWLDGRRVRAQVVEREPRWFTLTTEPLELGGALHEISITTPYAVPVRFMEPGSYDTRELGVAVSSVAVVD
jgi:hypothetical protein